MEGWKTIPCSIYRGGTSKAVFLRGQDLPTDARMRDEIILKIFGSPDNRQIDGLGGATPTTSKVGIVEKSKRLDADVDYTFGQVSLDQPFIDFHPNCGNISAAVGPFAVQQGMVKVQQQQREATVRIFNTNTNTIIHARFSVHNGNFFPNGEVVIPGVPGTGSAVLLDFLKVDGGVTGRLFPTGSVTDQIKIQDGRLFTVTVIDAGNLTVLLDGDEIGVSGTEVKSAQIQSKGPILETLEEVRQTVGSRLKLYPEDDATTSSSHALPKVAYVQHPNDYITTTGKLISRDEISLTARVLTMGNLHPAYAVTGGIALAVAACVPGTIAYQKLNNVSENPHFIRIGHPSGILEVGVDAIQQGGTWKVRRVTLLRTARPIMDGHVWLPKYVFESANI